MKVTLVLQVLAILYTSSAVRFVSYIGQAGTGWGTPGSNEDFLEYIGVPGYGEGSKGYNVLNFAFWVSNSNNGGAAVNGAAYDWQNIASRITSSTLQRTLTGTSSPSSSELRAGIKAIYAANGISICISAFGGADHPMVNGKSATSVASDLADYAILYNYDCVDIDWEEGIAGKLNADGGGEDWLCTLTDNLRSELNSDQHISHAPQAPYFRCDAGDYSCNYPNGGYVTVNNNCGDNIDWYNIQFYNQGSTKYDTYDELFVSSSGWSTDSAVYQIMSKGVPAEKIIVGKHTSGDGSTFVSGSTLKSIFTSAISTGQWNAGFMTWQFYREVAFGSSSLIDSVKQVDGWDSTISTTSTTRSSSDSTTTTSTTRSPTDSTGNIIITNVGSSSQWFYAASLSGVSSGYSVSLFEIQLSDGNWHSCDDPSGSTTWYKCQSLPVKCATPLSVRITSGSTVLTSYDVVTSFTDEASFDFGKNFANSGTKSITTTITPITTSTTTTTVNNDDNDDDNDNDNDDDDDDDDNDDDNTGITITNRGGSGAWWYMVTLSDIPSDVIIESIKMRASNNDNWVTGVYKQHGDYYVFSEDVPYEPPIDFKLTSTDDETITSHDLINSFDSGESGTMQSSFSSSYNIRNVQTGNDRSDWKVWFVIIVCSLCVIGVCVGGYIYYKMAHRGKAYIIADKDITNMIPIDDDKKTLVAIETQENNVIVV